MPPGSGALPQPIGLPPSVRAGGLRTPTAAVRPENAEHGGTRPQLTPLPQHPEQLSFAEHPLGQISRWDQHHDTQLVSPGASQSLPSLSAGPGAQGFQWGAGGRSLSAPGVLAAPYIYFHVLGGVLLSTQHLIVAVSQCSS